MSNILGGIPVPGRLISILSLYTIPRFDALGGDEVPTCSCPCVRLDSEYALSSVTGGAVHQLITLRKRTKVSGVHHVIVVVLLKRLVSRRVLLDDARTVNSRIQQCDRALVRWDEIRVAGVILRERLSEVLDRAQICTLGISWVLQYAVEEADVPPLRRSTVSERQPRLLRRYWPLLRGSPVYRSRPRS